MVECVRLESVYVRKDIGGSNPPPSASFIDKDLSICFNLSMDPAYEVYKDKIGARITRIMGESLLQGILTEDQAEEISSYLLENIDLAKTNSELLDFITNLSAKWPIFSSILASPDQTQAPLPVVDQAQEKTHQIVHAAEDLIKENKIDEALEVTKTVTENPGQNNPQSGTGGII